MPMPTEDDIQRMHRYFAVECNNNAWELAERAERTGDEEEEMIRLSEVAAWHWSKVGTAINFARADMLRGWVCCLVGWAGDARAYADRVSTQLQARPEGMSAWDSAFTALLEAYARRTESDEPGFQAALDGLDTHRAALDEDDQQIFDQFRSRIAP